MPAFNGACRGTTSSFWSFGFVATLPVAIVFPPWSLSSTLENFEITPSLKVSLISVGSLTVMPSEGLAALSVGWASADEAARFAANSAKTATKRLEAWRSDLIKCGRELQSRRAFRGSSFVDDSLRLLDRLTCRIGLIGQVKAGKSSLTNALACKPDMLPTDVNPFTTVVTNLHFGRTDVPTDVAAEFTFFQANEWEQLAAGVRHIRELTERLVPGFDVEQLHKQVDALRRRSEQRLGAGLGALLGQKHVFSSLSSELLNRYVASDLSSTGTEEKEAYSDIVKAADLYFASSDFGFPTTIIDTPGTNDPFLVRDEIARRALESAHVHIVVLTSRQAMSTADVALLRILQGLRKDRIAVFINRIDELGNIARDVPVVIQHVRNGLRRDLPTLELPVVAGSAYWANAALRGSKADVERAWSKNAKAYAQHLTAHAGAAADHDGDEQMAQSLLLCSGIPALLDVVAALTLESHAGRALKRISQSFYELANVSQNTARQELAVIESEAQSGGDPKKHGEDELRAVDAEAKEHERLTQALQSMLTDLKERSALTISDQCGRISSALHEVVRRFSEVECRNMRAALFEGGGGVWRCDPVPLQRQLEERLVGLTPVWWTGEYYRSSDLMWILLVLAVPLFVPPCGARTFVPAHSSDTPARAGPVKIGRRAYVSIRRDISRPHLEGPEHDGSVVCVGISLPRVVALVVDR